MNGLLEYHDVVIYTDCDELLVADPRKYASLRDMLENTDADGYTAIGLDVIQSEAEADFDMTKRVSEQRRYARLNRAMFKTLVTRKQITWGGGFHTSTLRPNIGDLFLFHLRYVDLKASLERVAVTRGMEWSRGDFGGYQRLQDEQWTQRFNGYRAGLVSERFFALADQEAASQTECAHFYFWGQTYQLKTPVKHAGLIAIDNAFVGKF